MSGALSSCGRLRWAASVVLLGIPAMLAAETAPRKAATVSALLTYPVFYHAQRVAIRAEVSTDGEIAYVTSGELKLPCLACPAAGSPAARAALLATFWDPGRLDPSDPRLPNQEVSRLAERLLQKTWPGIGELLLVVVERAEPADPSSQANLRAVALEPDRFEGQRVTLVGRFRGRNLYGDLPEAPRQSRWDFVLQSGDAAVWVAGLQPRGDGFRLDPEARVDTNRWLEVSGIVHRNRGLVWIEADRLALAEAPPVETTTAAAPRVEGPPPEVVFSAPTYDEVDVAPDTTVRIQFSRDMDSDSFRRRVRATYLGQGSEAGAAQIVFSAVYHEGQRFLEITFSEPLEQFRTVEVELLPGLAAVDGATQSQPWRLRFTVGRS